MIPNLMQDFGGAEPVVILHSPLQGRLGEGLIITRPVRVQQHRVQPGAVSRDLENTRRD